MKRSLHESSVHTPYISLIVKVNRSRTGCGILDRHAKLEWSAFKKQLELTVKSC
jgi:hypothetical protein